MQRVTLGITRTVFLVGPFAIKVPNGRYRWRFWWRGTKCNRRERRIGKLGLPQFCPILFADPLGLVVVMRRAAPNEREMDGLEFHDFFRPTFERFRYWIPTENKADSFGYLNGRLVAVDYGNGE